MSTSFSARSLSSLSPPLSHAHTHAHSPSSLSLCGCVFPSLITYLFSVVCSLFLSLFWISLVIYCVGVCAFVALTLKVWRLAGNDLRIQMNILLRKLAPLCFHSGAPVILFLEFSVLFFATTVVGSDYVARIRRDGIDETVAEVWR